MKKPPTKEFCLQMAKYYYSGHCPHLMWDWLVVWGFYEMYLEIKKC